MVFLQEADFFYSLVIIKLMSHILVIKKVLN